MKTINHYMSSQLIMDVVGRHRSHTYFLNDIQQLPPIEKALALVIMEEEDLMMKQQLQQ